MDLTGTMHRWKYPQEAARQIQEEIRRMLGFTVNIGISTNKLLAKMASDFEKPEKIHTLYPEEIGKKMWPLPVENLFFAGPASSKKLRAMGISTIGELAGTNVAILRSALKKQGEILWAFANGREDSAVTEEVIPNKGYGNSTTVPEDICEIQSARLVLLALCETLGARLREAGHQAGTVSVTVKDITFQVRSRQKCLEEPTSLTGELYRQACILLEELWDGRPLRHLGVHTSKIREENGYFQMRLFEKTDPEKTARMGEML